MTEDLQRQMNMGEEAARLLENPAFEEMWRRMDAEIHKAWLTCPVRDMEGQLLLLQQAKLCNRMRETVIGMLEQGKLAASKMPIDDIRNENAARRGLRSVIGR